MVPNTAATMRQSSTVPTTASAGTIILMMVDEAGTVLEGVASKLLVVDVVNCVLDSERCVPISSTLLTGGVTANDCDDIDGTSASAECVVTVEQFIGISVSSSGESQHILSPLVQTVTYKHYLFET